MTNQEYFEKVKTGAIICESKIRCKENVEENEKLLTQLSLVAELLVWSDLTEQEDAYLEGMLEGEKEKLKDAIELKVRLI